MEFWGVEVKAGESFEVSPGEGKILHLSQASLGESKKGKGNETVPLTLKFDNQKLVLGTLSSENFPQLSFDLVFEKTFELSHNWKNGSVYFCGYKTIMQDDDEFSDYSDSDEEMPMQAVENGKPEKTVVTKGNTAKPEAAAKSTGKPVEQNKDSKSIAAFDEEDSSDEDDSDDDESDDEDMSDAQSDDSENDESDDEDEDTPKKPDVGKKRHTESATKTPTPAKKAKLVTPQKTDGKKGGHTATPYPSKQASKAGADASKAKTKTPKSGGDVQCKSCSRTFKTEASMQSHSAAKHSAGK